MKKKLFLLLIALFIIQAGALADAAKLRFRMADTLDGETIAPSSDPRPYPGDTGIPTNTSLHIYIKAKADANGNPYQLNGSTINIQLSAAGNVVNIMTGGEFCAGFEGLITPANPYGVETQPSQGLSIYAEHVPFGAWLDPDTTYQVTVSASAVGSTPESSTWSFTTAQQSSAPDNVTLSMDMQNTPITWKGTFYNGHESCYSGIDGLKHRGHYDLMQAVRNGTDNEFKTNTDMRPWPKAWGIELDGENFADTDTRLKETLHIISAQEIGETVKLHLGDMFGHWQYKNSDGDPIPPLGEGNSIGSNYSVGDTVILLGFDNKWLWPSGYTTTVEAIDNEAKTVTVAKANLNAAHINSLTYSEQDLKALYGPSCDVATGQGCESTDPDDPTLYPPPSFYISKYEPTGNPYFYHGQLEETEDDLVNLYDKQLVLLTVSAPIVIALDGQWYRGAKDYHAFHDAVYSKVTHLLDKYGDRCLDFYWEFSGEYELVWTFYDNFTEFQKMYDYQTNAVYKAFEDHYGENFDNIASRIKVGGLGPVALLPNTIENLYLNYLGYGLWEGGNVDRVVWYTKMLYHCSPSATAPKDPSNEHLTWNDVSEENFVCIDNDAEWRGNNISATLSTMCSNNNNANKGAPLNHVNIKTYTYSDIAANRMKIAREKAFAIDPAYFADISINSFYSSPFWTSSTFDRALDDIWLGNGYNPSWSADIVSRMLKTAKDKNDAAFAEGTMLFTVVERDDLNFGPDPTSVDKFRNAMDGPAPWINAGITQKIFSESDMADTSGYIYDKEPVATLPTQDFHFFSLLNSMGDTSQWESAGETEYWLLNDNATNENGFVVSGFASKNLDAQEQDELRLVIYSHNANDLQSVSEQEFNVNLVLSNLPWENNELQVKEYRFDKEHNTCFDYVRNFRLTGKAGFTDNETQQLKQCSTMQCTNTQTVQADNKSIEVSFSLKGNSVNFVVIKKQDNPPTLTPLKEIGGGVQTLLSTSPGNPTIISGDKSIVWTYDDDTTWCQNYIHTAEYRQLPQGQWTNITPGNYDPWVWIEKPGTIMGNGTHEIRVSVEDCYGNKTSSGSYYVTPVFLGMPTLKQQNNTKVPLSTNANNPTVIVASDPNITWGYNPYYTDSFGPFTLKYKYTNRSTQVVLEKTPGSWPENWPLWGWILNPAIEIGAGSYELRISTLDTTTNTETLSGKYFINIQ